MTFRVQTRVAGATAALGPPSFATLNEAQRFVAEMASVLDANHETALLFEIFNSSGRLIGSIGRPVDVEDEDPDDAAR